MKNYIGLEESIEEIIDHFFAAAFPRHFGKYNKFIDEDVKREVETTKAMEALSNAAAYFYDDEDEIKDLVEEVRRRLPLIKAVIDTDIQAAYEGDPAAKNTDEIVLSYPCFRAISIHRLAHELYLMKLPVIPRMLSERMHSITGIDIHPGATIGNYFFIDHGTGVVIGETTTIGERVKLYQHVTLGAKSFEANEDGTLVKGLKRHPDIGDRVVIYAGATILGGNTRIGDDAVIGGNTWITSSVEAGQTVTIQVIEHKKTPGKTDGN